MRATFGTDDEAEGGVGGFAGMKSEGMVATVEMMDTYRTISGMEPRNGLMSWASCVPLVYTLVILEQ
jgi:hypothetical protein